MRAYSEDLRRRIVQCVVSGQAVHNVAERFQVSARTVWRYLRQYREEGNLHPKPHPGRPPKLTPDQRDALREQLRRHPSLALQERRDLFRAEHGVDLSIATMHRWVKRLRYSRKKPPSAPSSATKPAAGRS